MSLYVIGDLHLCYSDPDKTMAVFPGWENYQERIRKNWLDTVRPEDTVVLAGDISWGMSLQQAEPDLRFINELPGRKIILKGNHDYWWVTLRKMEGFFAEKGFDTLNILHNNHYEYEGIGICGTRGWVNGTDNNKDVQDEKVLKREVQRLETSIKSAVGAGLEPIVFMHYPPIFASNFNYDILEVLYRYRIKACYYGHIHGRSAHALCVTNTYDDIDFHLVSGDYTQFMPVKVM
ncbi:MAG: metallophosphoesterase [Ruminococcus sp.]|nr:metallophosphoesterase [Ruminococcus sp.]